MSKSVRGLIGSVLGRVGIALPLLALLVILAIGVPGFRTIDNLTNVLRQISVNGVLAVGMTFVILVGGIDLSVGSVVGLAGMVGASLVHGTGAGWVTVAALAALGTGMLVGLSSGLLVARMRLPAFVVTLGMLSAVRGLTLIYSDGMPISNLSGAFKFLGQGVLLGVPVPVALFASTAGLAWWVLTRTLYGRWLYAVGGNVRSAVLSGIPARTILCSAYAVMGLLAGLAGLLLTARTTAALPQAGASYELDAIAAVVIGGTSLAGGTGGIGLTVIGVLLIGVINNGLDLAGVSSYYQQVIKGMIIVTAVVIDRLRQGEGDDAWGA